MGMPFEISVVMCREMDSTVVVSLRASWWYVTVGAVSVSV